MSFDLELGVDHLESGVIARNKMWAEHGIFEVPYEHGLIITSHFYCLLKELMVDSHWVTVYSSGKPIRFKITVIWFLREIQNAMTGSLCLLKTRKYWTAVLSYCDALYERTFTNSLRVGIRSFRPLSELLTLAFDKLHFWLQSTHGLKKD